MQNIWKSAVASTLLATTGVHAQTAPTPADAKALVAAMQVAEQAREAVLAGLQKAIEQGRASRKQLECTKSSGMEYWADAYAAAFAKALSADEIKDATAFFASPEGKGYLRYSRSQELQQRGIPDADPKSELTEKETGATLKFLDRSAGKKLLEQRSYETAEFRSDLLRGTMDLQAKCGA